VDPVALTGGLIAFCGAAVAWWTRRRAARAEAEVARLRQELAAERHAAAHDPLTGLPNRRAFYQLGPALVADPKRQPLVAVLLDLDDFKQINDRLGHAAGDEVLITVARRFAAYAGNNLVARLGGDEFAGLLTVAHLDETWLSCAARDLADVLAAPMLVAGCPITLTASVGVVPVHQGAELSEVLRHADAAMYRAKSGGYGVSTAPLRYHLGAPHRAPLAGWVGRHQAVSRPLAERGAGGADLNETGGQ
jgi:diguanylate cyclase (GGDEF)-like protein